MSTEKTKAKYYEKYITEGPTIEAQNERWALAVNEGKGFKYNTDQIPHQITTIIFEDGSELATDKYSNWLAVA